MIEARERGFDVALIYVGTSDPSINVARVANRVALGGHDVPEIDIRRRYERSLLNLPIAVSRADISIIFDNSTEDGYQVIAVFNHGKTQWFHEAPSWAASLDDPALSKPPQFSPSLSSPSSTKTADNPTRS